MCKDLAELLHFDYENDLLEITIENDFFNNNN